MLSMISKSLTFFINPNKTKVKRGESMRKICVVIVLFFFVAAGLQLSSCASIVSKSLYPVNITSQPENVNISITDGKGKEIYKGTTPTTVTLNTKAGYFKGQDYTVAFEKEGYTSHTARIGRGVDGWYIGGNILIGGLIGWLIVDPLTGAMWTLDHECHGNLTPIAQGSSKLTDESLKIVSIKNVPESMIKNLKRIN
jgi:hypothetical protein